jgi:hypothetical protein
MLDHISLSVANYAVSRDFYIKALKPLGYGNNIEAVCHAAK